MQKKPKKANVKRKVTIKDLPSKPARNAQVKGGRLGKTPQHNETLLRGVCTVTRS